MKKLILSAVIFISPAYANWDDPNKPFSAIKNIHDTVNITWRPVTNVQKVCEAESKKRGHLGFGYAVDACSFWEGNDCTIITSRNPTMHSLGHEVRHCFQGNWH
jgi:hypothetical protein